MRKPEFMRYQDDDVGKVHAEGLSIIGSATLCGAMYPDGLTGTSASIDCPACLAVIAHVHGHRRPK